MNGSGGWATLSSIPQKTFPASGRVSIEITTRRNWPARGVSGPSRLHYFFKKGSVLQSCALARYRVIGKKPVCTIPPRHGKEFLFIAFFSGNSRKTKKFFFGGLACRRFT
jgi:hypothetical protein